MLVAATTVNVRITPKHHFRRSFIQVCQEAMELNSRLISTDQLLYHDELKSKFQQMQLSLAPLLDIAPEVSGNNCKIILCTIYRYGLLVLE